jgi:hypothetical protein
MQLSFLMRAEIAADLAARVAIRAGSSPWR